MAQRREWSPVYTGNDYTTELKKRTPAGILFSWSSNLLLPIRTVP